LLVEPLARHFAADRAGRYLATSTKRRFICP